MAKIDVSTIEGYADMTAEQKLAALESYEYNDMSEDYAKLKKSFDKASSDVAEWKKKHNALLSEEELKKAEQEAAYQNMQNELESLRKEKTVSSHKARFLAMGYDESLAEDTAKALADGNLDIVFANQQKHQENREKKLKSDALRGNPIPPAGTDNSLNNFQKMADEATARGDFATAAAYMRMVQTMK